MPARTKPYLLRRSRRVRQWAQIALLQYASNSSIPENMHRVDCRHISGVIKIRMPPRLCVEMDRRRFRYDDTLLAPATDADTTTMRWSAVQNAELRALERKVT